MEYVALILAAAIVVAVIFRKPLLAAYKEKFGKEDKPEPAPAEPIKVAEPVPVDPVADYQSKLPASTLAFKGKNGDPKPQAPVDRGGHDLTDGSPRVNSFFAGQAQLFTFTLKPGAKNPEINVFGAPGKVNTFAPIIDSIPGFRPKTSTTGQGDQHKVRLDGLPAGSYTYSLETSKPGVIGVQLHQ